MKKVILFAAIFFSAVSVMNVQAQTKKSGEASLTLNLSSVQSIVVGGDVVIDYTAADDYANGKGSAQVTTLTVVSAGGYSIKAEAQDLKDATNATSPVIAASSIAVTATGLAGATGAGTGTLGQGVTSSLITSATGGVGLQYTVSYKGSGGNEYMKNYNGGGRKYKTTVLYTIATN